VLHRRSAVLAVLLAVLLVGCANPQRPSGGPRDETPPRVLRSNPAQDAVNVSTGSVTLNFSEYVERASLTRAISVTPAFDRPLEYDWDGRSVEIEFPSALRDSTTYIVTLDTELSDTRGVSLEEPITIAFSTGPRINRGTIAGTVVEPNEGAPQSQVDIYAYAAPEGTPPDSLPDRPEYRTQTGEDGTFTLEYLREQPYYVIAIRDNNRNRRPDVLEPIAPPPRPVLPGSADSDPLRVPWTITRLDTIAPELRRVQPRSQQRVTLRFSEPVRPSLAPSDYTLVDSVRNTEKAVASVYADDLPATAVDLRTAEPMQEGRYRLTIADSAVVDTLGRALPDTTLGFGSTTQPDTVTTRFVEFLPSGVSPDSTGAVPLLPGDRPGARFNQPVDTTRFGNAIAARDTLGAPRTLIATTEDGTGYRFTFDPPLGAGTMIELAVDDAPFAGADTTFTRRYRRVTTKALGELEGQAAAVDTSAVPDASTPDSLSADSLSADATAPDSVATDSATVDLAAVDAAKADSVSPDSVSADTVAADSVAADSVALDSVATDSAAAPLAEPQIRYRYGPVDSTQLAGDVVVELHAVESTIPVDRRRQVVGADTTFLFGELPQGSYRFRAFLDRNGNGRWDPGQAVPYAAPEPVTWSEQPTESRPRWTTVLPAPLRIPVLARPLQFDLPDSEQADDPAAREPEEER
jgi:hypothetical protein